MKKILAGFAFFAMLGLDLLILPNCNSMQNPGQPPEALERGKTVHSVSFNINFRHSRELQYFMALPDWTYGYRRGMGNGMETGVQLKFPLIPIFPSGAQVNFKWQQREEPIPLSWQAAAGFYGLNTMVYNPHFLLSTGMLMGGENAYFGPRLAMAVGATPLWEKDSYAWHRPHYLAGIQGGWNPFDQPRALEATLSMDEYQDATREDSTKLKWSPGLFLSYPTSTHTLSP